ncbi:MAG: hypothetical protein R2851_08110 [Caldilineaceae bacterium]
MNCGPPAPEGLFRVEDGELSSLLQPQAELACCAVTDTHLLVGGVPRRGL